MKHYFSIPDFYLNFGINNKLLNLFDKHPEMINDNVVIESVYGSFPCAIWNGGRTIFGIPDAKNVENTLAYFNNRGIACRYTFTNCLLEKKHLGDTWCNLLMEKANNGINSVILNSNLLEQYVRENYPRFSIVSSTTKCIRDIDKFNQECEKDYQLSVLHYDFNNKWDELKQIQYPERVEIVVNESCVANCHARESHYASLSRYQLTYGGSPNFGCQSPSASYDEVMGRPHYVSYQDIVEKYAPMGVNHFKIVGRAENREKVVESYVQYFIKPEWQTTARLLLRT